MELSLLFILTFYKVAVTAAIMLGYIKKLAYM